MVHKMLPIISSECILPNFHNVKFYFTILNWYFLPKLMGNEWVRQSLKLGPQIEEQ